MMRGGQVPCEALTSEQDEAVILLWSVLVQLHLLIWDTAQGSAAGGAGGAGSPPPQPRSPLLISWNRIRRKVGVAVLPSNLLRLIGVGWSYLSLSLWYCQCVQHPTG